MRRSRLCMPPLNLELRQLFLVQWRRGGWPETLQGSFETRISSLAAVTVVYTLGRKDR